MRRLTNGMILATLAFGFWGLFGVHAHAAGNARRSENAAVRQAIRVTPLLERPDRPGHFYGNTVRRINERRAQAS